MNQRTHRTGGGGRIAWAAAAWTTGLLLLGTSPAAAQTPTPEEPPRTAPKTVTAPPTAVEPPAGQGAVLVNSGLDEDDRLELVGGQSRMLTTAARYSDLNAIDPTIADVSAVDPTHILVIARKAGATQVIVRNAEGQSQVIDVVVKVDTGAVRALLGQLRGAESVRVNEFRGKVILQGTVPNLRVAEQAQQVAAPMGEVINFLEVAGGQQVMLHVVFAEVSRSATSALGVNLGFTDGRSFGGSNIGQISPLGIEELDGGGVGLAVRDPSPSVTLFGVGRLGSTAVAGFLQALREDNLLRVLAEPNLVAISGEEASFLAGGEYPIPVTQGGSGDGTAVTIEFREFGVRLRFLAIVQGDGRIRLKCMPEVSDLDFTTAVTLNGFVVPGLSQRRVSTTVELGDGQALAIAGLLRNNVTAVRRATPVLGDLPVLGTLFRSVRYQRQETELVVFVTPRLVAAVDPAKLPEAPGAVWRHPTENDLFLTTDLGGPVRPEPPAGQELAPLYYGPFGFNRARAGPAKPRVAPVEAARPAGAAPK
jgi:pilus assembly protein CpaC